MEDSKSSPAGRFLCQARDTLLKAAMNGTLGAAFRTVRGKARSGWGSWVGRGRWGERWGGGGGRWGRWGRWEVGEVGEVGEIWTPPRKWRHSPCFPPARVALASKNPKGTQLQMAGVLQPASGWFPKEKDPPKMVPSTAPICGCLPTQVDCAGRCVFIQGVGFGADQPIFHMFISAPWSACHSLGKSWRGTTLFFLPTANSQKVMAGESPDFRFGRNNRTALVEGLKGNGFKTAV